MFRRSSIFALCILFFPALAGAGNPAGPELRVLPAITHGNLTIFPVVGAGSGDYAHLLTLDEGVRNGTVIVTETGSAHGLVRGTRPVHTSSGEVNRLVLYNDSERPLLLLAGEIVTGGKQDRVIGADRIIPAHTGPVDLSVFCVEPGRWVANSEHFDSTKAVAMAQPSVRNSAMNERNQQRVWNNVNESKDKVAKAVAAPSAGGGGGGGGVAGGVVAREIQNTTSYATVMSMPEVQSRIKAYAGDYEGMLRELKKSGARGVVVAVNGRILWADVFANSDLLEKYWQKLVRSYAAEAFTAQSGGIADMGAAQRFVDQLTGTREVAETEPGVYRRSEISGQGFKVFTLTSLLPKAEQTVHIAKMAYAGAPLASVGNMIR